MDHDWMPAFGPTQETRERLGTLQSTVKLPRIDLDASARRE
jgi:hypothetical protein